MRWDRLGNVHPAESDTALRHSGGELHSRAAAQYAAALSMGALYTVAGSALTVCDSDAAAAAEYAMLNSVVLNSLTSGDCVIFITSFIV